MKHVGLRFFERNLSRFISITTNTELIDCFFPLEVFIPEKKCFRTDSLQVNYGVTKLIRRQAYMLLF